MCIYSTCIIHSVEFRSVLYFFLLNVRVLQRCKQWNFAMSAYCYLSVARSFVVLASASARMHNTYMCARALWSTALNYH